MAKKIPSSEGPSPAKAAIMLHEGVANGRPISDRQRRFFGARSNESAAPVKMAKRGKRPKKARSSPR